MRVAVALAVTVRDGRVLVARRAAGDHLPGTWEFPGGKIERGEEPSGAARRELREETGLEAVRLEPLVVVRHDYADREVTLHAFLALDTKGEALADRGREWAWVAPDDLETLGMPEANGAILEALRRRLG